MSFAANRATAGSRDPLYMGVSEQGTENENC